MKLSLFALAAAVVGQASAFAPAAKSASSKVVANAALDDLKSLAEKSNPVLKVS